jgi:hypothetical protein
MYWYGIMRYTAGAPAIGLPSHWMPGYSQTHLYVSHNTSNILRNFIRTDEKQHR